VTASERKVTGATKEDRGRPRRVRVDSTGVAARCDPPVRCMRQRISRPPRTKYQGPGTLSRQPPRHACATPIGPPARFDLLVRRGQMCRLGCHQIQSEASQGVPPIVACVRCHIVNLRRHNWRTVLRRSVESATRDVTWVTLYRVADRPNSWFLMHGRKPIKPPTDILRQVTRPFARFLATPAAL
jgi:hypothetical protein